MRLRDRHSALPRYTPSDRDVREMAATFGLVHLQSCMSQYMQNILLLAFMERWLLYTNTFHMPFCEMRITLHNVELILGISTYSEPFDEFLHQKQITLMINRDLGVSLTASKGNDAQCGILMSIISCASDSVGLLMEIRVS